MSWDEFDDFRRIAPDDGTSRNIFRHDGARGDDGIVPDRHPWVQDGPATNPHSMSDRDGLPVFKARDPFSRVERMRRRIHMNPRPEHAIVTELDRTDIEEHAVKISEEPFTEMNVIAVVTFERWLQVIGVPG